MFIREKYKIRHKILEALYKEWSDATPNDLIEDISTSVTRIADLSILSDADVFTQMDYLLSVQEIKGIEVEYTDKFYITNKGRISFHDKKYLDEGRTVLFSTLKDWITLVSIIVAIAISVFSFITNYFETKKNTKAIEEINEQLKRINPPAITKRS